MECRYLNLKLNWLTWIQIVWNMGSTGREGKEGFGKCGAVVSPVNLFDPNETSFECFFSRIVIKSWI